MKEVINYLTNCLKTMKLVATIQPAVLQKLHLHEIRQRLGEMTHVFAVTGVSSKDVVGKIRNHFGIGFNQRLLELQGMLYKLLDFEKPHEQY